MKTIQKIQTAAIVVVMLMAVSLADSLEPTSGELAASIALVVSGGLMTMNLVRELEKAEAEYGIWSKQESVVMFVAHG